MTDELAEVVERFRGFARFSPSPLYRRLSGEVADRPEATALLLEAPRDQRWPMLLFAAVNFHRRRLGLSFPADGAELLEFCRTHREPLLTLIRGHSTQTNEVARCAYLLPCFALATNGRPMAVIEVGSSRGLVLNLDRYAYDYSGRAAGDPGSPLRLSCELRAGEPPLALPPIASRVGVDLAPEPDDDWLRACVFADQPERLSRLDAALEIATEHPTNVIRGDALDLLGGLIVDAPPEAQVVVFHTAITAYLQPAAIDRLAELTRDVTYITGEHTAEDRHFVLSVNGERVGQAHPHGAWLEWTG